MMHAEFIATGLEPELSFFFLPDFYGMLSCLVESYLEWICFEEK